MDNYDAALTAAAAGFSTAYMIVCLVIAVLTIIAQWKLLLKQANPAGQQSFLFTTCTVCTKFLLATDGFSYLVSYPASML